MQQFDWQKIIRSFDERRDIAIPGNEHTTIEFSVQHFLKIANNAIKDHKFFSVALSGGSTPKAIYRKLASPEYAKELDWSRVLLFWSDERCALPTDPESNFRMAMEAGFASLPVLPENIFRMPAEIEDLESGAKDYEDLIKSKIPTQKFDLIMLGMGEDGHTASLFPKTHGLHTNQRLVIANYIPQKNTWRMSLTFECINKGRHVVIYVLGKSKAQMVKKVLLSQYDPDTLPVQRIGIPTRRSLWILDRDAASELV